VTRIRLTCALSIGLGLWCLAIAASTGRAEDPPAARPSIVEDYKRALALMEARYARIKGDVVYLQVGWPSKPNRFISISVFHSSKNGGRYKQEVEYRMSRAQNGPIKIMPPYVSSFTPEEYFSLRKDLRKETFVLSTHRKPPGLAEIRNSAFMLWPFVSPYSIDIGSISTLLTSADYTLASETPVVLDGRKLVRLRFELIPGHERNAVAAFRTRYWYPYISLLVSPDERYVIRGYSLEYKDMRAPFPIVESVKIEYVGTLEGFPIPERVVEVALDKTGAGTKVMLGDGNEAIGDVSKAATYVLRNVSFTPDPESAFTLGAFGIQVEAKPEEASKTSGKP